MGEEFVVEIIRTGVGKSLLVVKGVGLRNSRIFNNFVVAELLKYGG